MEAPLRDTEFDVSQGLGKERPPEGSEHTRSARLGGWSHSRTPGSESPKGPSRGQGRSRGCSGRSEELSTCGAPFGDHFNHLGTSGGRPHSRMPCQNAGK